MSGLSSNARQWIGLALLLTTGGGWLVWWAVCSAVPTTAAPPPVQSRPALVGGWTFAVMLAILVAALALT